jgi:hypothetical protein
VLLVPTQFPPTQVSVVHTLPSEHGLALSFVPTQPPFTQASSVHAFPSEHGLALSFVWPQTPTEQLASVHSFASSPQVRQPPPAVPQSATVFPG